MPAMFKVGRLFAISCALVVVAAIMVRGAQAATLPQGFTEAPIGGSWNEVVGITFADDGRTFVWERGGRVFLRHNDQWNVIIDIREEVGGWRDFGLLGVALHPNFLSNGQIFLLYVVDRHHLMYYGTPEYNPNSNWYFAPSIGRITRYTLDPSNNFLNIVPGSRAVLVGETKSTGFPILHESHGIGGLDFGSDGTLLASCGDGASYNTVDTGGWLGGSYALQALSDGIIKPKENVGAYRSQLIDCHNGKLIRIDPNTGDGVPSNPFYDPALPRAPKSRVWALGLRNPCRITLRPESGSHNPADGNPGAVYIGDVGWNSWEELNVCTGPAQNFGWPAFEGMNVNTGYWNATVYNGDAENPLWGIGCTQRFFQFRELIQQDTLEPDPFFPNPCNPTVSIPDSIPTFVHRRAEIDWGRPNGPARTGIYNGMQAAVIDVGAAGSPIAGPQFGGNCSIGGVWAAAPTYPQQYRNTYFHGEYGNNRWIRSISFDSENQGYEVRDFAINCGDLVALATHPITGELYYINWVNVYRISYSPSANQPPVAVATADQHFGPAPLTVQFSGSASSDPDNQPLEYLWDFGDGETSREANPSHTFKTVDSTPASFNVSLTVTDSGSLMSQTTILISVNNTPPDVSIVSPAAGSNYPVVGAGNTLYHLAAQVTDAEHSANELTCQWQVTLHHNNHEHPEPFDMNCATTAVLSPVGCDGNTYFYRIQLTVTDGAGLSASDEIDVYPNCEPNQLPAAANDAAVAPKGKSVEIDVLVNDSDADGTLNPATVVVVAPPAHGTTQVDADTGAITYTHDGSAETNDSFGYTVNDNAGGTSNVAMVSISGKPAVEGDINGDGFVDVIDLLAVISAWGRCPAPPTVCDADVNNDGAVNVLDLLMVINNWG